ncbi:MAG TPA: SH3 domain-containing protein [Nitriliruptorales bacterium]
MRSIIAIGLVLGLTLAGCSDDTPDPTVSETAIQTTSPAVTTGPSTAPTGSEFPGEPFGRAIANAAYLVVGVAHDDTLNVRSGPGVDFGIVNELDPTGSATATGDDRLLDSGLWIEVTADGVTGWANYAFLALAGGTFDVTSEIITANGGEAPQSDDMTTLAQMVAQLRASTEPPSDIQLVVAPTEGDLWEVTVDVIGLGDDAQKGERLHVFAEPITEGYRVKTVEMTVLCDRGVDGESCV